jgi:xanthine dehydrogenase YagS FAD-binding subunit
MKPFAYERAADVAGALAAYADGARYLAGGTNLVDLMKLEVETPARLIDVTHLGLDTIDDTPAGGLWIGAGVSNNALAADRRVRERYPVLAQALAAGASGQLRNRASVGGNLLQRTRCRYFQDITKPCNKRTGGRGPDGCSARDGEHRNLAILGHSPDCVATHPSDMAVALAALDAVVHVRGAGGARAIPLVELHRLPGDDPSRDTVLEPGDLIEAVELRPLALAAHSRYRKVRDRASFAFAIVSVAAAVDIARGTVQDVRLALGGVAHKPWRATVAEAALRGGPATEDAFAAAAAAELAAARPLRDNAFKVGLAQAVLVQTLNDLVSED